MSTLQHLLDSGIWHHARQFHHLTTSLLQLSHYLVVDTVALDAATTIAQHHLLAVVLQLFTQFIQCILAEVQLRGIVECEIA